MLVYTVCFYLSIFNYASGMVKTYRGSTRTKVLRMSCMLPDPIVSGSWFAILAKSGYEGVSLPVAIEVAGEKLVAWKNPITSEWSVMQDACPHRLAPLSQGRVDPETGCIECPYHGQQFNATGVCTKIPQSSFTTFPARTSAITLPVHSTGDLLWAYLNLPKGQASNYPTLPEIMMPELLETHNFFVRDLPYSFDFVMENFMDPSHLPFAHHSMQGVGVRSDGSPVPMHLLTSYDNATHLEVGYQIKILGKTQDGLASFVAPSFFHYKTQNPITNISTVTMIAVLTPISPGSCRLFLELPVLRTFKIKIPQWLSHSTSNRFFDTDVWVHDQERTQRSGVNPFLSQAVSGDTTSQVGKKYVLTTQSDTGSRAWRIWWAKHMVESPVFGEPKVSVSWMSRESQLDRYENHAKHCSSCRGALDNASTVKKLVPFLAIFLAFIAPNTIIMMLGIAFSLIVNEAAELTISSILGPDKGDVSSAAQFPTK